MAGCDCTARQASPTPTGHVQGQQALSVSLNKLGDLAVLRQDMPAAAALYRQGLAVRRRIVRGDAQGAAAAAAQARHRLDLAVSLGKLADAEQVLPTQHARVAADCLGRSTAHLGSCSAGLVMLGLG